MSVSAAQVRSCAGPQQRNPVFNVNTSGGYGCGGGRRDFENEGADICRHIARNEPAGEDIYYPAHVTDSDHQEHHYSLSDTISGSGDADLFSIDQSSGTLFTTAAHIYDSPSGGKFEITITVTDASGGSDSIGSGA